MKIKKIEFENFRNFREYGEIRCSTDGKVTIIYGMNGDGKTTLHQLLQWIFYNEVSFNKTTSEIFYNIPLANEKQYKETFDVMGRVEFEHKGNDYSLTRKYTYRKDIDGIIKIKEDLSLMICEDYNWNSIESNKVNEIIEKVLPSGLLEYFFFDGESMIADLSVKGKDSALKLKKSLYSMFNLDIIEESIKCIGDTSQKTTVLGKLFLSKADSFSDSEVEASKNRIEEIQDKLNILENNLKIHIKEQKEKEEFIKEISEKIGSNKSKKHYENVRQKLKQERDLSLKYELDEYNRFGEKIIEIFPNLLISKAVDEAKTKINFKIENEKLPLGINKKLVEYLLEETTCICGNNLNEEAKKNIERLLDKLPPKGYDVLYNDFNTNAKYINNTDVEDNINVIEKIIENIVSHSGNALSKDNAISEIDEEEKKSENIQKLVIDRIKAENDIENLKTNIKDEEISKEKLKILLTREQKIFDEKTNNNRESKKVSQKIAIMENVLKHFKDQLENASSIYSKKLQNNIQILIDNMLTTNRIVNVSEDFAIRVTDNHNDESKSEGQFAVVTFAYIGGILNMLKEEPDLKNKEYPLVLDGPFSKLDKKHRALVISKLLDFAPQVIVFSKDDLHNVFEESNIGYVWTIQSNEEKNISYVKEGKIWR